MNDAPGLVITLLCELRRRKKKYGLATASIGGGQGVAVGGGELSVRAAPAQFQCLTGVCLLAGRMGSCKNRLIRLGV